MAVPDEGETAILTVLLKRSLTDRDADLEMGLYTNSTLTLETATEAALTEPATGGYARQDLTDASWSISSDEGTYANVDFTASGADITGVYGVFIASKAAGGTPRLWTIIEYDSPPLTISDGATFRVTIGPTLG
jgi:hypothetical protein